MAVPVVKAVSGQDSANENTVDENNSMEVTSRCFSFILIGI